MIDQANHRTYIDRTMQPRSDSLKSASEEHDKDLIFLSGSRYSIFDENGIESELTAIVVVSSSSRLRMASFLNLFSFVLNSHIQTCQGGDYLSWMKRKCRCLNYTCNVELPFEVCLFWGCFV